MRLKVVYTLDNGRATQSKHTSYESSIGVTKTWFYEYRNDGLLIEKYNKDNLKERMKFDWTEVNNLVDIEFYNGNNQKTATLQFQRGGLGHEDKLQSNSERSSLDPYLKIFGPQCTTVSNGEFMTYHLSPNSNIQEAHGYTYDRDGYITRIDAYDPLNNWAPKYSHKISYNN